MVKNFARRSLLNATKTNPVAEFPGRSVVIAGSCSPATRRQIQAVASKWPAFKLDIDALSEGASDSLKIVEWALAQRADSPLLIYASSSPDEVALTQQKFGVAAAGELVEAALGEVVSRLVDENFDRIIVAGGETSAAVIAALGVRALSIGPEIGSGLPWTLSQGDRPLALALKSGNFGQDDFFSRAFAVLDAAGA